MTSKTYLDLELKSGLTLSQLVHSSTDLAKGRYAVIHCEDVFEIDGETKLNFKRGTQLSSVKVKGRSTKGQMLQIQYNVASDLSDKCLAELLLSLIGTYDRSNVILENAKARRGDRILQDSQGRIVYHNRDVYHVVDSKCRVEHIMQSLRNANSLWIGVGFVVEKELAMCANSCNLLESDINDIADNVLMMFASSFDQEGYVLWYREHLDLEDYVGLSTEPLISKGLL